MTIWIFASRLGWAFLFGALVGLERQYRQKSAGLRTNTLVSLGAASFILLSSSLTAFGSDASTYSGDPSRVAGQIVTGIGFLGAGVIMKTGLNVQGLNTAATIWCSAAVGSLAGAGLYMESALTAVAISLTHIGLRPIGMLMNRFTFNSEETSSTPIYRISICCKENVENHLRIQILNAVKANSDLQLRALKSSDDVDRKLSIIDADILANGKQDPSIEKLVSTLTIEYGVAEVSWEVIESVND
ncbi:MAG: MgtC/SapB family protein [Flavobacteriales bacterium]|nr:MAG: MgtC/SapB family protein [Flavobacteriales bacterium]